MSYLVIARKYRPLNFDEVMGQQHVSRTIQNAIRMGRIAHAYLFSGPRGVGKTTVARILAKALNCKEGPTPNPCNLCPICIGINEGSVTDVHEIDGASNTGVDNVRELRENVRYLPSQSRYNIYIIDEVHMLSINAFNALLKILEEPPSHVIFIFATTEPHKIPVTIISRTQRFDFKRINIVDISRRLKDIAKMENIEVTDGALTLISREAEGSMRDAQSLLDQVIGFTNGKVTEESIMSLLGLTDRAILFKMAESLVNHDASGALSLIDEMYRQGYDTLQFYRELVDLFRDILIKKVGPDLETAELTREEEAEIIRLGKGLSFDELTLAFHILFSAEPQIRSSADPKIALELAVLKMTRVASVRPIDEILERLGHFESPASLQKSEAEKTLAFDFSQEEKKNEAESKKKPRDDLEVVIDSEAAKKIDDFLTHLSRVDPKISSLVGQKTSIFLSDDRIIIEFPKDSINFQIISEETNITRLKREASGFFKKNIDIDVRSAIINNKENITGNGNTALSANDPRKQIIDSETTKNIITIFDDVTILGYTKGKKE